MAISVPKELVKSTTTESSMWSFLFKIFVITLGFILFKYFYNKYQEKEAKKEHIIQNLKVGIYISYNGIEGCIDKINENTIRIKISENNYISLDKEFVVNNLNLVKILK